MKPAQRIWFILFCLITTGSFAQSKKTTDSTITPKVQLKTVNIIHYNFFKDSIAFREEYGKAITFRRPKWYEVYQGMSVNINQLYRVTQYKKNKKKLRFRQELLDKEQDMYVNGVYTPSLVNKVTQLDGDSLQLFMQYYRPAYAFIKNASEYDIYAEIKKNYLAFIKTRDSLPPKP